MSDHQEYQILVGKTDFSLGGVHVYVEFHVGHVQEQDRNGLALGAVRFVGLLHRLANHFAFDGTITDEQELVVALAVCFGSGGYIAPNMDPCFGIVDWQKNFGNFGADGFGNSVAKFAWNAGKHGFIADFVIKANFGVRNGCF